MAGRELADGHSKSLRTGRRFTRVTGHRRRSRALRGAAGWLPNRLPALVPALAEDRWAVS